MTNIPKRVYDELRRYEYMATNSTDMMAFLTPDFIYRNINDEYLNVFGLEREEVIGKSVSNVFGKEIFESKIKPQVEECLKGQRVNYQDTFVFPKLGAQFMDITYTPCFDSKSKVDGYVVNAKNITERELAANRLKQNQDILEQNLESLQTIQRITVAVMQPQRPDQIAELTSLVLQDYTKANAIGAYAVNEEYINCIYSENLPEIDRHKYFRSKKSFLENSIVSCEVEIVESLGAFNDPLSLATGYTYNYVLEIPLIAQRRAVGVIALFFDTAVVLSKNRIDTFNAFSRTVGLAFANAIQMENLKTEVRKRKTLDKALLVSQTRYRTLFMQAADAIFLIEVATNRIVDSNNSAQILYGYSESDFREMKFEQLLEDPDEGIRKRLKDYKTYEGEEVHLTKNGASIIVSVKTTLIEIGPNTFRQCICRDITAKKESDKQILTLSRAMNSSPVSVMMTDINGEITYVNPNFEKVTGYSAEEAIGRNPNILKSGLMTSKTYKDLWRKIKSGGEWNGELLNKKKDGSLFWEQASISGIKDEDGQLIGFMAIKEDIGWRKRIQRALFNSKERYRSLITLAPDPIVELDTKGYILSANPAFLTLLGFGKAEKERYHFSDTNYLTKRSVILFTDKFKYVMSGKEAGPFTIELVSDKLDLVVVEVNLKLITYEEKKPVALAICRDITEREKAKDTALKGIMHAEDRERARISSEIHDGLQQTLVCSLLEFEQVRSKNKGSIAKDETFLNGYKFLNNAINESRAIAHSLMPKTVEDDGLVQALTEMVDRLESIEGIKFILDCSLDESSIDHAKGLRIYHIAQEAVNNALKYAHPSDICISLISQKKQLMLEVFDNGYGFDSNKLEHKSSFGVRTMRHKAEAISAKFDIKSEPGIGTRVTVLAPIV